MTSPGAGGVTGRAGAELDAPCLALITLLPLAPYLWNLGFYSDDWGLIVALEAAARTGNFADYFAVFGPRPVHALLTLGLYELFGLDPRGYHFAIAGLVVAAVVLFYLLLRRLDAGQVQAFVAAAVLAVLPQLSTIKLWMAAAAVPLAMVLMLVSLHCQLSFARNRGWPWAAAALVTALASIAAYELFAPLIAAFAAWLAIRHSGSRNRRAWTAVAITAVVLLLAAVVAVKLLATDRVGSVMDPERYAKGLRQLLRWDYDWRSEGSLNVRAALEVHLLETVAGWWKNAIGQGTQDWAARGFALAAAGLTYWRVRESRPGHGQDMPPLRLFALGLAAFVLGHAVFLVVPQILFSPAGVANRVLVAAAIGVAIMAAALLALLARAFGEWGRTMLATSTAAIVLLGSLRTSEIAAHWVEADRIQTTMLASARTDLRALPPGSTVIFDGICPYHGPAAVFETEWDVGPALTLSLGRPLTGNVVTDRMRAEPQGLATSIYLAPSSYPYGANLYLYHAAARRLFLLNHYEAARSYFAARERFTAPCPKSYPGHGVPI